MFPAPSRWVPWLTPNGKACIEQLPLSTTINKGWVLPALSQNYLFPGKQGEVWVVIMQAESKESDVSALIEENSKPANELKDCVTSWVDIGR